MRRFNASELSKIMRTKRAEKRITQRQLAEMIGANVATIGAYERGVITPSADKIVALCEALDCTPNDLMGWAKAS